MKTPFISVMALAAFLFCSLFASSLLALVPPDGGGGGGDFVEYDGANTGLWSDATNWTAENDIHRAPVNDDDIYLGLTTGTTTTDDITSLFVGYLDFIHGTNLLTIEAGKTIDLTDEGIHVGSGATAFIDVNGVGASLSLSGQATAGGADIGVNNGGTFSIASLAAATSGTTIGSLQGTGGTVDLGAKELTVGSSNSFTTYSGTISGSGGSLTKIGSGALTLTQANTYSGGTNIYAGTLGISNDTALGTSALTIGQTGMSNSARLNVSSGGNVNVANNITVASLTGGATATISSIAGPASGLDQFTGSVTLNGSLAIDTVAPATNPLAFTGQISGNGGVTINPTDSGAVSFTHANSYNGNTTVQGGTFFANNTSGSATGNGNVFVNSGATLAGNGAVAGITTVNSGATLAPGNNGIGILHVGNAGLPSQSLILAGNLSLQLGGLTAGTGYDQVITATGAAISGTLSLTLTNNFQPMLGNTFFILDDNDNSNNPALRTTGSFSNAPGGVIMDNTGNTYAIIYAGHDPGNPSIFPGDVELIVTNVVPEPSTWMLVISGIALMGLIRLRRRTRES